VYPFPPWIWTASIVVRIASSGEELRLRRRELVVLPHVLQPRGLVREEPAGLDSGRHIRQFELDRLELRDRAAELLAIERVGARGVERALCDPQGMGGDPDSPARQRVKALLKAAALFRSWASNPYVLEISPGCARPPAELSSFLPDEALPSPFRR
jgi:hypothetical protein